MAFDVYNLMKSEEIREYLRKNRKFTPLEQESIIRHSYYPIEQKQEFLRQLLEETNGEERGLLEERVRLFECVMNFIHNPGDDVIYMAQEEADGYQIQPDDNDYRLSESLLSTTYYAASFTDVKKFWDKVGENVEPGYKVCVDMVCLSEVRGEYNEMVQPAWFHMIRMSDGMHIVNFGIDDEWFMQRGFSEECLMDYFADSFRSPLPFEHGCRVKLQTPAMAEPVYGVMDSSQDCYGCWYHYLLFEDAKHSAGDLRKQLEESEPESIWEEVDSVCLSYPLLDLCDHYLTYDWIERAQDQKE